MASPLSPAVPVSPWPPPTAPVVHPTQQETYGFIAAGGTYVLAVAYLLWAFLPDVALEAVGISWFPNREWAVLLPAWSMVLVMCTYAGYGGLMLYNTSALSSTAWLDDHDILDDSTVAGERESGPSRVLRELHEVAARS